MYHTGGKASMKIKWVRTIAATLAVVMSLGGSAPVMAAGEQAAAVSEDTSKSDAKLNGLQEDTATGKILYYKNGEVDQTLTSVVKAKNGNWYYVRKGAVDFSFSGFARNQNGWWYVEDGMVSFRTNGMIKGKVKGESATWYVRRSKVIFETTVAKNSDGKWYFVRKGKYDKSYTGLAENENGLWYIKNGKLDRTFNGLVKYKGDKWRVRGGKVDRTYRGVDSLDGSQYYFFKKGKLQSSYSGTVKFNGMNYKVKNGRAQATASAAMLAKAQKYTSPTGWLILIDRKAHKQAIFSGSKGNWRLRRYYTISDGKSTPNGQFNIGTRFKYYDSVLGNRCWYCVQIKGYVLFHSVLCHPGYSYPKVKNGTLGKTISKGCIRQPVNEAKWLYTHIPRNTKVVIYK